jgi:hypothetical protein
MPLMLAASRGAGSGPAGLSPLMVTGTWSASFTDLSDSGISCSATGGRAVLKVSGARFTGTYGRGAGATYEGGRSVACFNAPERSIHLSRAEQLRNSLEPTSTIVTAHGAQTGGERPETAAERRQPHVGAARHKKRSLVTQ